jgi:site-specific DNA-cytosine methylase
MITFGSIYTGAGAPLLAAQWAGCEPRWAIEPRTKYFNLKTHRFNFRNIPWSDQIKAFYNSPVDILWGSPSCSEISASTRNSKNAMNVAQKEFDEFEYTTFIQEIKERKPKIFILENLAKIKNFLRFEQNPAGTLIRHMMTKEILELPDYYIEEHEISPVDIGFPQNRNRLFVIGSLFPYSFFLLPPTEKKTNLSIRSIFTDLDERRKRGELLYNDKFPVHGEDKIEKMSRLKAGEGFYGGMNQKRMDPDKPSPVIMSSSTKYIHPWENRTLTVRESASLMGYPLDFQFFGSENKCLDQVGKGIVPQVGSFIIKQAKEYLESVNNQ